MKLKHFGLFLASIGLFAACSSENPDGPQNPEEKGGAFFTVKILPKTRTTTPDQGSENGQPEENAVKNVLIVIADNNGNYLTDGSAAASSNKVTFNLPDNKLEVLRNYTGQQIQVFAIVNPAETYSFDAGKSVQKTLTVDGVNSDKYWKSGEFLMTNADEHYTVAFDANKLKNGDYNTAATALNLGTINVQRATARLDLTTTQPTLVQSNGDPNVGFKFDGVALVNMSKNFYMFKQVGSDASNWKYFTPENGSNWALDPKQEKNELSSNFGNYFFNPATGVAVGSFDYFDYTTLSKEDDANIDWGKDDQAAKDRKYYIWRYISPNNILGVDNQKNGNSTGLIFRAEMVAPQNAAAQFPNTNWGTDALYVYEGHLFGSYADVAAKAANPSDSQDYTMSNTFKALGIDSEAKLVSCGLFKRYKPVGGKYYCYYPYWVRHNDNNNNQEMGNMEFQIVRNNVYKVAVTKVSGIGMPGAPDDPNDPNDPTNPNIPGDPDPGNKLDPNTPDEIKNLSGFISVEIKVLPWGVRTDELEF